jgi:hypothetical protein
MTEINPTKIRYGSFGFVGNEVTFHKTTGKPFSITYATQTAVNDMKKNDKYGFGSICSIFFYYDVFRFQKYATSIICIIVVRS